MFYLAAFKNTDVKHVFAQQMLWNFHMAVHLK